MEGQEYRSYGIRGGETVIEDISLDRDYVARLAQQFCTEGLAAVHLRDAVIDALIRDSEV